ncbi:MAG: TolC family protein [Myxococcota bacterium]|nr:TolC family protein [Myxococcota bacterium]
MGFAAPAVVQAEPLTLERLLYVLEEDSSWNAYWESQVLYQRAVADTTNIVPAPRFMTNMRSIADFEVEQSYGISQAVPLNTTRVLRKKAELTRVSVVEEEIEQQKNDRMAEAMRYFFRILWYQERSRVLRSFQSQQERIESIVESRSSLGEDSLMDKERQHQRKKQIEMQIQRDSVAMVSWNAQLVALIGQGSPIEVSGELPPKQCDVDGDSPKLRAVDKEIETLEIERQLASQTWLPLLSVQGGWVEVETENQSTQGWSATLGLSFPALQAPKKRQKSAEVAEKKAERVLLERKLDAISRSSQMQCQQYLQLAAEAEERAKQTQKLVEQAEAGYMAGYLSLEDWVEMQAAWQSDLLAVLDLRHAARETQIQLVALFGESK